jgi:hypothetical protein
MLSADDMPSGAEERAQNSDRPVVRFGFVSVQKIRGFFLMDFSDFKSFSY